MFNRNKMQKIVAGSLVLFALTVLTVVPAFADTFSGMCIDYTVYSVLVKNGDSLPRLFQIRPETQGVHDPPHPQDQVKVFYHTDPNGGALVADRIIVTKRYLK